MSPSASANPVTSTSDMNGPTGLRGKLTTATTCRPISSSGVYRTLIWADELRTPMSGPKSIHSLYAGRRASGNASTAVTVPTRRSTVNVR
jgi:hypothetical protein